MSRFLLLNLEEFDLTKDITKTIQPFNPFCICCLKREGPMLDLKNCEHTDFLQTVNRPELKQFNRLVCLQCHSILKKIKSFQDQVMESYNILLSGAFTDTTVNNKRINSLIIQKVVNDLHLPPNIDAKETSINEEFDINQEELKNMVQELPNDQNMNSFSNEDHSDSIKTKNEIQNNLNSESNFSHEFQNELNSEQSVDDEILNEETNLNEEQDCSDDIQGGLNVEQNFTNEFQVESNLVQNITTNMNIEHNFSNEIQNDSNIGPEFANEFQNESNVKQSFANNSSNIEQSFANNSPNIEQSFANNSSNIDQSFANNSSNIEQSFANDRSNMEQSFANNSPNIEQSFANNSSNIDQSFANNSSNIEQSFANDSSNMEQNFTNEIPNILNEEESINQTQNRFNKNIKTALEILERNNQSFVSLSSQLQFINGEHLSFLETSLLSKEILTDIPLVPIKNLSTDLGNELLNNTKALGIEIDGTDKMFYDTLVLSPELMEKEAKATEIVQTVENANEDKIKRKVTSKSKKKRISTKPDPSICIRRVRLSHEELDRERVLEAQSDAYLNHKFRCETCIVGFNFKENLDDHLKRKHGPEEAGKILCEICSQVIPDAGHLTEHNYRHYTRYECIECDKRFHTYDKALQHCSRGMCANVGFKPIIPTAKLRRGKLK